MRTFIRLTLLALLVTPALAQNVRYSAPYPSVSSSFATPFLVANVPPNSPRLAVCGSPANANPCTNYVTTYDSAGNACANGAQDTPDPQPSACQATGDAQGNIGFWAPPGKYDYTVCVGTTCDGPYTVTLGATGSVTLETNGVANSSQSVLNFFNSTDFAFTDNGAGAVSVNLAGSGITIHRAQVTLTSAQLKSLTTVPIDLIAAQGANTIIVPVSMLLEYVFSATPYAATGTMTFFFGSNNATNFWFNAVNVNGFLTLGANAFMNVPPANSSTLSMTVTKATGANAPLRVGNSAAAIATGDGTVVVTIYYRVESIT